ncbi:MAG TPA: ferrochelatase [Pararhizobium sp.]|nr:ferrochelatase [Pararhizobium sp.]
MTDEAASADAARSAGLQPADHSSAAAGKVGVLLVNLGTPDATDKRAMRRYLGEFLSDRRVIETPRALWYPILHGIILNTRPAKVGKAYGTIWNKELDESYLRTYTRNQADLLGKALAGDLPEIEIDWAMRYGRPSIPERLTAMKERGCDLILLFPLYPQYSAATTATVNDKAFETLIAMRWQPALRTVPPYPGDPAYIEALAVSVEKHLAELDWQPELVLASFHGLPQAYVAKGDPYQDHCQLTARLLRERLGWPEEKLKLTFQSRFGPQEWLQPYTDKTVEKLAADGVKRLAIINPGFVSDCLETLEEIAVQARESFEAGGGKHFTHIPCLNDSTEGMMVIETVVRRELQGWV